MVVCCDIAMVVVTNVRVRQRLDVIAYCQHQLVCNETFAHKVESNGIEVKVEDVLTGFIRRAELARDRGDQRPDKFAIGEKVDAKVTAVDRAARRLALTIKGKEIEEEREAVREYGSSDSGASLGDILGAAIRRRREMAGEE